MNSPGKQKAGLDDPSRSFSSKHSEIETQIKELTIEESGRKIECKENEIEMVLPTQWEWLNKK